MSNKAPIIVLCPMDCEYSLLKSSLSGGKEGVLRYFEYTEGEVCSYPVVAVKCLTGTVNAAAAAISFIDKFSPRCVIIQGTAGAHNKALSVNDIVLGETVVENQTHITSIREKGEGMALEKRVYCGVEIRDENGNSKRIRTLSSDSRLLQIARRVKYEHGSVIAGSICTADAWNRELDYVEHLRKELNTDCEEMESFAVVHACKMCDVPCLAMRVISNNELTKSGFSKNSAEYMQLFCLDVIKEIINEKA